MNQELNLEPKLNIVEEIKNYITSEIARGIKQYPVNSNWASQLGHPCTRFLTLRRLFWREEEKHNVELQSIFDEGNEQHDAFTLWLKKHGVKVIMEEVPFPDKEAKISGRIDGICQFPFMSKPLPFEFKSMSNFAWNKVDSWDDIKNSKSMYTRNYVMQFNTYLYLAEYEQGIYFLKNKDKGMKSVADKTLIVSLDYDLAEQTLRKCKVVNESVVKFDEVNKKSGREEAFKTLPDYIKDVSICTQCSMRFICQPPLERTATEIVADEEIIQQFTRMMELKPLVEEHNDLQKMLKKPLEGRTLMLGNYMVQGKWIEVAGRTQEVKPYKYWKFDYAKIEEVKK